MWRAKTIAGALTLAVKADVSKRLAEANGPSACFLN